MLTLTAFLAGLAIATGSQKAENFMTEDWPDFDLKLTGEVKFTLDIPQFRGRRQSADITIGLFGDHVPYTVANFAQLAAGGILVNKVNEDGETEQATLSYRDTPFHRMDKDISIQGGDVVYKDGSGSITIYNSSAMLPENYVLSNYGKGWVGMIHNGYASNFSIGCQFYICMSNNRSILHALNQQPFVVFGKVLRGMEHLDRINSRIDARWGGIPLNTTLDPLTGFPVNRPLEDITITESSYTAYPESSTKTTTNSPSSGSLVGEWPTPESERQ